MCCICSFFGWTLDLIQHCISYVLACYLGLIVIIGMLVAVSAGVAYGYNYSLAEYISLKKDGDPSIYKDADSTTKPPRRRMYNHDDGIYVRHATSPAGIEKIIELEYPISTDKRIQYLKSSSPTETETNTISHPSLQRTIRWHKAKIPTKSEPWYKHLPDYRARQWYKKMPEYKGSPWYKKLPEYRASPWYKHLQKYTQSPWYKNLSENAPVIESKPRAKISKIRGKQRKLSSQNGTISTHSSETPTATISPNTNEFWFEPVKFDYSFEDETTTKYVEYPMEFSDPSRPIWTGPTTINQEAIETETTNQEAIETEATNQEAIETEATNQVTIETDTTNQVNIETLTTNQASTDLRTNNEATARTRTTIHPITQPTHTKHLNTQSSTRQRRTKPKKSRTRTKLTAWYKSLPENAPKIESKPKPKNFKIRRKQTRKLSSAKATISSPVSRSSTLPLTQLTQNTRFTIEPNYNLPLTQSTNEATVDLKVPTRTTNRITSSTSNTPKIVSSKDIQANTEEDAFHINRYHPVDIFGGTSVPVLPLSTTTIVKLRKTDIFQKIEDLYYDEEVKDTTQEGYVLTRYKYIPIRPAVEFDDDHDYHAFEKPV